MTLDALEETYNENVDVSVLCELVTAGLCDQSCTVWDRALVIPGVMKVVLIQEEKRHKIVFAKVGTM